MTQKPRGTERVVLLDTFRCIVCLYIKVLLEFLGIMRPRLLIIAPAIRLQGEQGGGGGETTAKKKAGWSLEILKRTSKWHQDPV